MATAMKEKTTRVGHYVFTGEEAVRVERARRALGRNGFPNRLLDLIRELQRTGSVRFELTNSDEDFQIKCFFEATRGRTFDLEAIEAPWTWVAKERV